MNFEIVKIALFTLGVAGLSYIVSRIFYALLRLKATSLHLSVAPVLGLLLLASQLWLFGLIGLSWNRWLLLLPWLLLGFMLRKRLLASVNLERQIPSRILNSFKELDYLGRTLVIVAIIFSLAFLISLIVQPFITSDILAIWGYKAKEFYNHSRVYINPRLSGTINSARFFHLDYPPLLPLSADVFYVLLGHVNESLFKVMQFIFLVSGGFSLFIYTRSVLSKKDRSLAAVFLFLFIAVPQFLPMLFQVKYMGYADYPLAVVCMLSAIFVLRSINTLPNHDWLLALLFGSFAAVIKNEGLAFVGIVLLILSISFVYNYKTWAKQNSTFKLLSYLVIVGIVLLPSLIWLVYKRNHDINVDFAFGNLADSGMNLFVRLRTIGSFIWLYIRTNPIFHWQLVALIIGVIAAVRSRSKLALVAISMVCLQLGSFVLSFIFSPYDLKFHILSSIDRLMTQVLPLIILSLAVSVSQLSAKSRRSR